jgi:uncharacterized protein YdiU (UPF0061 family)
MLTPPFSSSPTSGFHFDNSYARLPETLFAQVSPVAVRTPQVVVWNDALAMQLGITQGADAAAIFSGNQLPQGAIPIAQAYAGHQFGHFTKLGDGRAVLLGEHLTPQGRRIDIQLKGSGQTPFSRRGDGRAALGPMLREYIISEAMHGLGIPTTRSLSVVTTGEPVLRETLLPGAVLTRVSASHIRVGTFEYVAALRDIRGLQILADYVIARHYPEVAAAENPYLALLHAVMERQARLVSQWQLVGFVHGVMNTDNMAISGETIDYGPCAFMNRYDPATVFSSIDQNGRYAYGNQPTIAQWNLVRFAETLLPLLHADQDNAIEVAEAALVSFGPLFQTYWLEGMRAKLGLFTVEERDVALAADLLSWMQANEADYTNTFRGLMAEAPLASDEGFMQWWQQWHARRDRQPQSVAQVLKRMAAHNPAVIARNHIVEEVLEAAVERDDYAPLTRFVEVLRQPYNVPPAAEYQAPPADDAPYRTFCGT